MFAIEDKFVAIDREEAGDLLSKESKGEYIAMLVRLAEKTQ